MDHGARFHLRSSNTPWKMEVETNDMTVVIEAGVGRRRTVQPFTDFVLCIKSWFPDL